MSANPYFHCLFFIRHLGVHEFDNKFLLNQNKKVRLILRGLNSIQQTQGDQKPTGLCKKYTIEADKTCLSNRVSKCQENYYSHLSVK